MWGNEKHGILDLWHMFLFMKKFLKIQINSQIWKTKFVFFTCNYQTAGDREK